MNALLHCNDLLVTVALSLFDFLSCSLTLLAIYLFKVKLVTHKRGLNMLICVYDRVATHAVLFLLLSSVYIFFLSYIRQWLAVLLRFYRFFTLKMFSSQLKKRKRVVETRQQTSTSKWLRGTSTSALLPFISPVFFSDSPSLSSFFSSLLLKAYPTIPGFVKR
eukprot:GILK01014635.1.p1 GENE.GILK01014635.1~~GILK01014635.1.p1  ORF type:complete len:163 (-),score=1.19 GILK01014635.1:338-826(-)